MDGPNALVLYFSTDPVQVAQTLAVCGTLGTRARLALPNEADQTVGWLAGLPGHGRMPTLLPAEPMVEPCMVLVGVSRVEMEGLFAALRAAGAPPPDRKAMLTPTNTRWTLRALSEELGREHAATHRP